MVHIGIAGANWGGRASYTVRMAGAYKARYDYVELTVQKEGAFWRLKLHDNRYHEDTTHEDKFPSEEEAKGAAMPFVEHHINIRHNDTLMMPARLSWQEF